MTTTTPTTTTEATEITIYRVAYLIETEEQDYELELWTDNEEEAWDCKGDFLNKRLKEIPELQEELNELLIYKESKQTGYIGLTEYYQTFNELFGSGVEIKDASIEQLMIYLEK